MLLLMEVGGFLAHGPFQPVMQRAGGAAGMNLGSMAAFLHLETAASAKARGAHVHAAISGVAADRTPRREAGQLAGSLAGVIGAVGGASRHAIVTSSGAEPALTEEKQALASALPGAAPICVGDLVGHGLEAQFPVGVALAAAGIDAGLFADVVVAGAGHHRGEGAARLVKA
jgi:3-oxoacyl-[acyl-carrier-protein] synthase II